MHATQRDTAVASTECRSDLRCLSATAIHRPTLHTRRAREDRQCTPSATSTGRSSTARSPPSATSSGLARLRIVGPEQGAIHTDLAAVGLRPGGWLAPHVHSFEEALYVLAGELLVDLGGRVHRLVGGDFALDPDGTAARARQRQAPSRSASCRSTARSGWTRPARGGTRSSSRPGTWPRMDADAARPPFGDPTLRLVGHYDGHATAGRGAAGQGPGARPRPAGMDTAILAYSGISREDAGRPRPSAPTS